MSIELERHIERDFCKNARARGFLTYKFVSPQRKGVPDQIVISPTGRILFIEFKRPTGKLSPLQDAQIRKLTEQGCEVWVIYSHDEAADLLKYLIRREPCTS